MCISKGAHAAHLGCYMLLAWYSLCKGQQLWHQRRNDCYLTNRYAIDPSQQITPQINKRNHAIQLTDSSFMA